MKTTRILCLLAAATALSAATEVVSNGGFESGTTSWSGTTSVIGTFTAQPAYAGTKCAFMGGKGKTTTQTLYQQVAIPSTATSASLSFYLHIDTKETTTSSQYDKLVVSLQNSSGTTLKTLATYSNLNKATGYVLKTFDVSAYKGQTVRVYFKMTEDSSLQTSFVLDNVSLTYGAASTDTTAPTVSAAETGTSGTITLSATASDNVGVTKVEWYIDGALVGSSTSSPYSLSYDSTRILDGSHSLVAKAYDAAGNVGSSTALSFTVTNGTSSTLPDPVQSRLQTDLEYFTGSTCNGRKTGTAGANAAAAYIAQKMQEIGLSPIKTGGLGGSTVYHYNWTYSGSYAASAQGLMPTWNWSLTPAGGTATATATANAYDLVGIIPGTDSTLKNEYIFVTAHYDHLGTGYPGADDNASGAAGLLEVARLLVNSSPKRTIAFLAVSGEEQGLLGSAAFLSNPPITLSTIKGDINLDMIGRNPSDCLHVMPAKTTGYVSSITQDARTIANTYGMTLSAGIESYWQDSDHYSFAQKSIPCVCFNTGLHNDLHETTDTAAKIGYAKMLVVMKIVRDLALKVANDSAAPSIVAKSVWSTWTWGPYTTSGPYSLTLAGTTKAAPAHLHKGDAGPLAE